MDKQVLTSLMTDKGKLLGDYLLRKVIGKGRFGMVYLTKNIKTGKIYAAKQIKKSELNRNPHLKRLLITEVAIMNEIRHPNILHLYDFLESKRNYYLIVNYCNKGSLEDYLKNTNRKCFKEEEAIGFLKQIASAFIELRKHKILHRDLKLDNIFFHNDRIVVGDFGFAKMGQEFAESKLGSPITMAYELLIASASSCIYNSKADLWSIGVIYYQMLFGITPFYGFTMAELVKDIESKANGNLKFPGLVSIESRELLNKILVTDPIDRLDWIAFFNHKLFKRKRVSIESDDFKSKSTRIASPQTKEFLRAADIIKNNKQPINFLDQDSLLENYKKKELKPVKVEENEREETIGAYDLRIGCLEFKKRFDHEKSFIDFFLNTYKKLRHCLKGNLYPQLNNSFFNLITLILKKAKLHTINLRNKFERRENFVEINNSVFRRITQTNMYWDMASEFKSYKSKINNYLKYTFTKAKDKKIALRNLNSLLDDKISVDKVNELIIQEYEMLKKNCVNWTDTDQDSKRYLSFIFLLIKCCKGSDNFFCFKNKNKEAFNWEKFYINLKSIRDQKEIRLFN